MSATLLSSLGEAVSLLLEAGLALLLLGLVTLTVSASLRSRKALQFEPWTDFDATRTGEAESEGQRVADLLLTEIREIQSVHQRSKRGLDLDNPYYDIPAFQQDLDDDLKLLASASPQSQGEFVGALVGVLLALVPVKPGRLQGTIHRNDGIPTLVANIDNLRYRTPKVWQWRVDGKINEKNDLQALTRTLAYEVYLELSTSSAFNGSPAFRLYTDGVKQHLTFGENDGDKDSRDAAVGCYEAALGLEPTNPAVQYNLGVLKYYLYESDSNRDAIELFESALLSSEGRLKAQLLSGLCNALAQSYHRFDGNVEDLAEARLQGEDALAIDRDLDVALKALAFAYHQSSEALISEGPSGSRLAHWRKIRRYRNRAIYLYRRTTRVNPRYYVAHNNLSNLYLEWATMCRPRKKRRLLHLAAKLAKQSIEVRPSYVHAYDNAANAYRALGELGKEQRWFDEAKRHYDRARKVQSDYLPARHDLALVYLCSGWSQSDYEKALCLHRKTVAAEPSHAARAKYEGRFLDAIRVAGLDAEDSEEARLDSILPADMLQFRPTSVSRRELWCSAGGCGPWL
jgi:tetratricopeptide (TPR) repeat protein